jgi:hypothetical protein
MIKIIVHPEYTEIIAERGEERTVMYIRENSTAVVKERHHEVLECHSFGSGPLQKFRELYFKESPPTDAERFGVKKV